MRNVALLEATMQQVKDHPELHEQGMWFSKTDCGTAACFAGWACILSGYKPFTVKVREDQFEREVYSYHLAEHGTGQIAHARQIARGLLGVSTEEGSVLFNGSNTRAMLELMVKDLVNGDELLGIGDYDQLSKSA